MNNTLKKFAQVGVCASVGLLTACSSVATGSDQNIAVQTLGASADIAGVQCELVNDQGKWSVTTPGNVKVRKSMKDLVVTCSKQGETAGTANVPSVVNLDAVGLELAIPVAGYADDVIEQYRQTVYMYPPKLQVVMGESIIINSARDQDPATVQTPQDRPSATPTQVQPSQDTIVF